MRSIGITGGVGAGKSEILAHLEKYYGAQIIEADKVGHLVMEPKGPAYQAVLEAFGLEILGKDGAIDRGVLGGMVFGNEEQLEKLNKIVHPQVKSWIYREMGRLRQQGCELFTIEGALLIEDQYEDICQELWYIHADADIRRERLRASRGYTDERIDAIFHSQLSEAEFRKHCQAVIDNSGSFDKTCRQIAGLFDRWNLCARP
ncbi:MAG: dephospho-CoA kinase [Lachnospiraceae bacterium]|nr:dephospho-CoA kinase [Lachnospiraceae bacterium]